MERQKLMERAWHLQDQAEKRQEEEVKDRAMRDAASELGLDPTYLEQARAELEAEAALEVAGRQQRVRGTNRKLAIGAGVVSAALVLGVAGWLSFKPPTPQLEDFSGGQARWTLDTNPGTEARVRWEQETGHYAVAVIEVDKFQPAEDGKFRANLDQMGERDLSGYHTLSFAVRGNGLGTVRVFLETPSERWRSPAIPVSETWTVRSIPLKSFEHQTRAEARDGAWRVVSWSAPGEIEKISFKVGHFMNEASATGEVWLDDLRLE